MNWYEKQKNMVVAGLLSPIVGLAITALIDTSKTIAAENVSQYSPFIWLIIVLIEAYCIWDDIKSILWNGPVFAICFYSSYSWLNGAGLMEIIRNDILIVVISCFIASLVLYIYENYDWERYF